MYISVCFFLETINLKKFTKIKCFMVTSLIGLLHPARLCCFFFVRGQQDPFPPWTTGSMVQALASEQAQKHPPSSSIPSFS